MQALIITAYHNYNQLNQNLKLFSKFFNCYVHIDARSELADEKKIKELNRIDHVTVISKYKINWGSYLHMMAIMDLLLLALKEKENTYFHIISGDDFPIKSADEFEAFFSDKNKMNYLELTDISNDVNMKLRYEKFHFMHWINRRGKNMPLILFDKMVRQIQYHLPFKRKICFEYKGLVWCSVTEEAARYVISRVRQKENLKTLKYCEIAEEFVFQNYLMGSEFKNKVVRNNYRYAVWDKQHVNGPRVLDIEDYNSMMESGCFFARKVTEENRLYETLYEQWNSNIRY